MRILVVAEHDGRTVRKASRCAMSFAAGCMETAGGETVHWLILGHPLDDVAAQAAEYAPVLAADSPALARPVADRYARVIADAVAAQRADMLVAADSTFAKDVVARAAGLLGGAMAGGVVGMELREGELVYRRPVYAGSLTATIALTGSVRIVTVRASAFPPCPALKSPATIQGVAVDEKALPEGIEYEGLVSSNTGRPDVTEAAVVVSGGRAIRSRDDFETLVGRLADTLGGAVGSTRALVDAGITSNDLQVGQTGKIVAPDLYVALGISGTVQHLAGMKNAKCVVAINTDPDAPIFESADFGLVADVYDAVPELIEKLRT